MERSFVLLFPFAIWVMMVIMNSYAKKGGWIPLPTIICSFVTGIFLMVSGFWNVVNGSLVLPFITILTGGTFFLFSLYALTIDNHQTQQ